MVFRKYAKRSYRKSRKVYIQRPKTSKYYKKPSKVHFFKRTVVTQHVIVPTAGKLHFANNNAQYPGTAGYYSLGGVPNSTEFSTLFDQYKICGIKQKFQLDRNSGNIGEAYDSLPNIYLVNDFDDGTPLSSENDYLQYESLKTWRMDKPKSIFFRPRITSNVYAGAITSGYSSDKSRWIDMTNVNVEHYGCKWMLDPVNTVIDSQAAVLKVFTTYYIACKNVR